MASVWYIGTADKRTITAAQWAAAGIAGASDTTWDQTNGWSLPQASLTSAQRTLLDAHGDFNTNAADGPRPGAAVLTPDLPFIRKSDLSILGIDDSQLRRKFAALRPALRTTITDPRLGPATTDISTLVLNAPPDSTTYNRAYAFNIPPFTGQVTGTPPPATWPADVGEGVPAWVSNFQAGWGSYNAMPRSMRVMIDGDKFCWYVGSGNNDFLMFVDDKPVAIAPTGGTKDTMSNAYKSGNTSAHFNVVTFPSKKVRKIDIRTNGYIMAIYAQKPYDLFRPPPRRGPRVLVIGDSFTASNGALWSTNSIYWNIGPHIESDDVWVDQIGGTGYGVNNDGSATPGGNRYLDRLVRNTTVPWDVANVNPDVVVVHGGGANDKYWGRSLAQIHTDVAAMFTGLRAKLPNAKLIFVEGFSPPVTYSGYNPDYITIRQTAQAALVSTGVYYVDVATTVPWLKGTGYNLTGDATENSYTYVASDGVHPRDEGHLYIRGRIGQKIRRIMADDGTLLNTLI